MKERKSPQEKKDLSYTRDRRNVYGENDKSSRKNIPLRKAKQNRAFRKKANEAIKQAVGADFEQLEAIKNEVLGIKKGDWKKYPDAPLGEVVRKKIEDRETNAGKGKTLRKKEREIKLSNPSISEE